MGLISIEDRRSVLQDDQAWLLLKDSTAATIVADANNVFLFRACE